MKNCKAAFAKQLQFRAESIEVCRRPPEKNEHLRQRYQDRFDVDVQKAFVRNRDEAELENTKSDLQWYVPHLPVLNSNKPDKVRRVCNAASEFGGVSLNNNLLKTRSPKIAQMNYLQIQEKQIALRVDVEAMFFRVKVPPCRLQSTQSFVERNQH